MILKTLQIYTLNINKIRRALSWLHSLGKTFVSFAENDTLQFSPESLCQIGHSIRTAASLLPALMELNRSAERQILTAELQA